MKNSYLKITSLTGLMLIASGCSSLGLGDSFDYQSTEDSFSNSVISKATSSVSGDQDGASVLEIALECKRPINKDPDAFESTTIAFVIADKNGDPRDFSDLNIKFDNSEPPEAGFLKDQNISKYSNVSQHWYSTISSLMLPNSADRIAAIAHLQGGAFLGSTMSALFGGSKKSAQEITHDLIEAALSAKLMTVRYETAGGQINTAKVNIDSKNYKKVLEDCGWKSWMDEWQSTQPGNDQPKKTESSTPPVKTVTAASDAEAEGVPATASVAYPTDASSGGGEKIVKPSFDCAKASNRAERMVCGSNKLANLDVELSRVYKVALKDGLPVPANELKSTQKEWNRQKNQCQNERCLVESYQNRISFLTEFDFN